MNNESLWQAVLGELELNLSKANFTTWFKNTYIICQEENSITVAVPNAFTQTWLENKYHNFIIDALKKITDNKINKIFYKITTKKESIENSKIVNLKNTIKSEIEEKIEEEEDRTGTDGFGLNPKYTFDRFVVGKNNELACAAAKAVAKKPGKSYNPLYIYGGVGLGKTHLLQAIGHEILKNNPKIKLMYATCEKFTNEFVNAIKNNKAKNFQNKYREVDVLILDDIQFISGKERTQEELFHTFNDLHQNNKQIVFSSDRTPKSIAGLEPRLESRFEWGMIIDISIPDLETKIAILQKKLKEKDFNLKPEILEFLATNFDGNIRRLEGILNRIIGHSELLNLKKDKDLEIEDIKNIIQSVNVQIPRESLTAKKIIKIVAEFYDIDEKDILGSCRKKELVVPRQIIMYLMREEAKYSFPNIGSELGGRDHTTAMHAYDKIKKEIVKNEKIKNDLILLKEKLYN